MRTSIIVLAAIALGIARPASSQSAAAPDTAAIRAALNAATTKMNAAYLAGDAAARVDGERGLLPTDLLPWLRRLANPMRR